MPSLNRCVLEGLAGGLSLVAGLRLCCLEGALEEAFEEASLLSLERPPGGPLLLAGLCSEACLLSLDRCVLERLRGELLLLAGLCS